MSREHTLRGRDVGSTRHQCAYIDDPLRKKPSRRRRQAFFAKLAGEKRELWVESEGQNGLAVR